METASRKANRRGRKRSAAGYRCDLPSRVLPLSVFFTWDAKKAAANARKHGVTFAEAETVFDDPLAGITEDEAHPERLISAGAVEPPPPVACRARRDRSGHCAPHQCSFGRQAGEETL